MLNPEARYPHGTGAEPNMIERVNVIGSGRVGSAVSARLREQGLALSDHDPELVLLCVPDRVIGEAAAYVTPGPWVAHVSGATPLAVLAPHVKGSLSCTGGVHTKEDAIKALLAGADTVQLVSVLLKHGPRAMSLLREGLRLWMAEHEYKDVAELRGALNLKRCPDPTAHERANYIKILQSWRI